MHGPFLSRLLLESSIPSNKNSIVFSSNQRIYHGNLTRRWTVCTVSQPLFCTRVYTIPEQKTAGKNYLTWMRWVSNFRFVLKMLLNPVVNKGWVINWTQWPIERNMNGCCGIKNLKWKLIVEPKFRYLIDIKIIFVYICVKNQWFASSISFNIIKI